MKTYSLDPTLPILATRGFWLWIFDPPGGATNLSGGSIHLLFEFI